MNFKKLKVAFLTFVALIFMANHSDLLAQPEKGKIEALKIEAEKGVAVAQFNLGKLYETGDGVEKSEKNAIVWYEKAAEKNYAAAQYKTGYFYYTGTGVEKDFEKAFKYMNLACDNGLATACANMVSLAIGEQEKSQYHKKACELGYKISCASILMDEQKFAEAEVVLNEECLKGNKKACNVLNKVIKPFLEKMNNSTPPVIKIEKKYIVGFVLVVVVIAGIIGVISLKSREDDSVEEEE